MIKYKRVDTKNGKIMYFKNGKMTSPKYVPESIKKQLIGGVEISVSSSENLPVAESNLLPKLDQPEEPQEERAILPHKCIFCDEEATRTRFINLQTIPLCLKDHQNHTTGEIVEQLRKVPA